MICQCPHKANQLVVDGNRRAKLPRVNARFEIGAQTGMDSREHGGRLAGMGVLLKNKPHFLRPGQVRVAILPYLTSMTSVVNL